MYINAMDRKSRGIAPSPAPQRLRLPLLVILLIAAWTPVAHAADIYVVCSAGVSVTMAEIRDVFLGEKQFAGQIKLAPVDNIAAQPEFLAKAMKMDAVKYTTVWTKKSFRYGSTPPPVKGADGEVIEFLKHTPGGCGYLLSPPTDGLTLIGKL